MNSVNIFGLLCCVAMASAYGWDAPAPHWSGPPAPLGHDGNVVDTPEVAHAKSAQLSALAAAAAAAAAHGPWVEEPHDSWAPAPLHDAWAPAPKAWAPAPAHHEPKWTGPPAHIELTHDGKNLKDTPEVAHAKAAHYAAVAAASAHAAPWPSHNKW